MQVPAPAITSPPQSSDPAAASTSSNPAGPPVELPTELWNQILTIACEGGDQTAKNAILRPLRTCSRTLRDVCDARRTSISIHNTHIADISARLSGLTSLHTVTVVIRDGHSLQKDLLHLYTVVPNLTSLTLKPGRKSPLVGHCVRDIAVLLAPWREKLNHLCLNGCKLSFSDLGEVKALAHWHPNLPVLQSLSLNHCKGLHHLGLERCHGLQTLGLCGNTLMTVDLSSSKALCRMMCTENTRLEVLDVSGCLALQALECHGNRRLGGLILPAGPLSQLVEYIF